MADITIAQVREQLARAEDRYQAIQDGSRPESDRWLALRALGVARSRLRNATDRETTGAA